MHLSDSVGAPRIFKKFQKGKFAKVLNLRFVEWSRPEQLRERIGSSDHIFRLPTDELSYVDECARTATHPATGTEDRPDLDEHRGSDECCCDFSDKEVRGTF